MEDYILDDYKNFVIDILFKFKRKNKWDTLQLLPVYNDSDQLVAYLKPITFDFQKTMPDIISKITKWKIENPFISASIMKELTDDMTRIWIKKYLLQRQDKLIFMIINLNNEYLGYMGVATFDFINKTLELDSALRGVKNTIPGLMTFVAKTLILFSYNVLKINDILGSATDVNPEVKPWHDRVGYKQYNRIPMKLVEINQNEKRWIQDQNLTQNIQRYATKVIIVKDKYKEQII